jgi:hypothetical protein
VASVCGGLAIAAAGGSDFVIGSFWSRHDLLTSLLAGLLVLAVTVAVLNEAVALRNRRRWSLLAQSMLFALVQHARATWTAMVEVLRLGEVAGGSTDSLLESVRLALDVAAVDAAVRALLSDPPRRAILQRVTRTLADHGTQVIAGAAPMMVGTAPYAEVLDRHVELQGRLIWLSDLLAQREPAPEQDRRTRTLTRSSVATENADLFDDDWIHSMLVAIVLLAARLDEDSRRRAYDIVPPQWWAQRTQEIIDAG